MITLVDDIIGLSRLDDGTADTAKEPIKLLEAAKTTADILKDSATQRGITLSVEGDDIKVVSVSRLVCEIIYNLCDNAIKYNRENGTVKVRIKDRGDFAEISVADTGIGHSRRPKGTGI